MTKRQWPARLFSVSTPGKGKRTLDGATHFKIRGVLLNRESGRIVVIALTESETRWIRDQADKWLAAEKFTW